MTWAPCEAALPMASTAFAIMDSLSPVHRCWINPARTRSLTCLLLLDGQGEQHVDDERAGEADHPVVVVERFEERDETVRGEGAAVRAADGEHCAHQRRDERT